MTPSEYQQWLGAHGHPVTVDGQIGPATRAATMAAFTNTCAPAVTDDEFTTIAARLGCSLKQLRAVSKVESGGKAYDSEGRPKILFERHLFHRLTGGKWSNCSFSNPEAGGYLDDSYAKLGLAIGRDVDAAFASASWGKFQVLGTHWRALGYASPLELAYSTVTGEAAHYELLARFIEANSLKEELRAISTNPADCVAFAKAYNGPSYKRFVYDTKLAAAMA